MAIAGSAPLEPFAFLTEGMRVEVRSGPFRGMQGVIERRGLPGRLHLQIGMLGRSMSMEVDASLLDPVD
jgi:transcription antitermination factor NusG